MALRRFMVPIALAVAAATVISAQQPAVFGPGGTLPVLDSYLEALRQQAGIPGMSAAAVSNGVVVWEKGYGFQNLATRERATPDTPYLVGDMSSMEREALRQGGGSNLSTLPIHMADMGTDNYEQEFTLGLVEKDRGLLREINAALAKIQNGTYGICEGTGKPIGKPRLEAQPWAKYSIEYARMLEKRLIR